MYCYHEHIILFTVFINMPEIVGFMRQNYDKWKEYNVSNELNLEFYFLIILSIFYF